MTILKGMKDEFKKRFQQAFNLGRYGTPKKPPDKMNKWHKEMAQSIFDSSCMTLTETGQMLPAFFLLKKDEFMPMLADVKILEKMGIQGYASSVVNVADETNAEAIMFISEQWMIKRKMDDEDIDKFEKGKKIPSLDPDRQEILTLIYVTKDGQMRTLMGEIQRQIDNTPFIRESEWGTPDEMTTSFFGSWGQQ